MSLTPAEKLVDLIDNFIDYVYNNIETLYGAENENEHEPIVIPRQFYARGIGTFSCMIASNFNTYWWGYGGWSLLYEYDISCSDGAVTLSGWNKLGRYKKGTWDAIHPYSGGTPNADVGDEILTEYIEGHSYPEIVKKTYPTELVSANYGLDAYTNPTVNFDQFISGAWTGAGLYNTYQLYNSLSENANPRILYGNYRTTYSEDYVYVDTPDQDPGTCYSNALCVSFKDSMLVTQTNDDTYINKYITNNGAEHNYTYTYETENGDEITVYYGDNYVIYKCDDDTQITYDDNYNIIKKIKDDTDIPIDNPTYHDKKYGPEPGPEPYEDDPWSGVDFSGALVGGTGAFAKVYYMTSTELANLRSWMASINVPEGFDPMAQIVSLSQVPVELSGDAPENVVFINSSAVYDPGVTSRAVDSGVATQQSMGLPLKYSLGNIDIARRMEERGEPYLDYDCQIELYLPLVGCFSLDTQAVMGRTITAEAVLDPISGTLAAYAWVEKDAEKLPIAYGSTTIGVDLPVSAQQYSISRAALKQANAQLGTSLLSSALTLIAAQASGGKGASSGAKTATGTNGIAAAGIREAGADYMKASQAGNVFGDFMQWGRTIRQLSYGNNTAISGSFGGSTAQWSYPFDAYVKIIRPRFKKPENYNHSQGVPCIKTMTIGECTGFIQCVGVDVSGITRATDLERQAIQAALCNGVYAGGGEE